MRLAIGSKQTTKADESQIPIAEERSGLNRAGYPQRKTYSCMMNGAQVAG